MASKTQFPIPAMFPAFHTEAAGGAGARTVFPLGTSGLGGATLPGPPTGLVAYAGDGGAVVAFTAPVDDGGSAILSYTVTSSPGGVTATGSASPIVVTGLTNGTEYTFTVHATNAIGNSVESDPSNAVTPHATEGVIAWWDASQITGLADGDPVPSWPDLSGNGLHATQATGGLQPTYETGELNDLPVVRFAGDYLAITSPGVYVGAACTVFVVSKRSDSHFSPLTNKDVSNGPKLPDTGDVWAIGGKAFAMQSADMLLDSWGIHTMCWDGASTYVYRHDGAAKTPSAEYTQTSDDYATHMGIDTTWTPGSGDIAEIIVYGSALSAADIAAVEAYLWAKWFAPATVYTVSGAGDSEYNGEYYDAGVIRNGQPVYTNGLTYMGYGLRTDFNFYWMLCAELPVQVYDMGSDFTAAAYFSNGEPTSTWGAGTGAVPVPTVT